MLHGRRILSGVFLGIVFVGAFIQSGVPAARAVERGTPAEARALVAKAVRHIAEAGRDQALEDFSDPKGAFVDRDLYIVVHDLTGRILAMPNPVLRGKDVSQLKDADGKLFVQQVLRVARESGSGDVDFRWPNPMTQQIEAKTSYLQRVEDLIVSCGSYRQ